MASLESEASTSATSDKPGTTTDINIRISTDPTTDDASGAASTIFESTTVPSSATTSLSPVTTSAAPEMTTTTTVAPSTESAPTSTGSSPAPEELSTQPEKPVVGAKN